MDLVSVVDSTNIKFCREIRPGVWMHLDGNI